MKRIIEQIEVTPENAQVIFVNHSGGKDSQAMMIRLVQMGYADKLVVVHADLGEMEHEPMHRWIESITPGFKVNVVKSSHDFFSIARHKGRLPASGAQFCTDTLKTQPCYKFMREYMKIHGLNRGINALGIRAQESGPRSMRQAFKQLEAMTAPTKNRFFAEWLPIFDFKIDDVFSIIASAGQQPHRVYSEGWSRLSCVICINGKKSEHAKAREIRPELYQKMAELERELGRSIRIKTVKKEVVNLWLDEVETTAPQVDGDQIKLF